MEPLSSESEIDDTDADEDYYPTSDAESSWDSDIQQNQTKDASWNRLGPLRNSLLCQYRLKTQG